MKSKQLLLWALAISCAAASPARVLTDQLADELSTSVEQLPTATADQRLKKAVLAWALEDAQAEEQVGRRAFADAVRTDVRHALTQQIGVKHDTPANLFPAIPEPKTNPYAVEAIKRARKLIAAKTAFVKGPAGAIVKDERGWHFPTIAVEALALTRALCHPQSELAGDPTIISWQVLKAARVEIKVGTGEPEQVETTGQRQLIVNEKTRVLLVAYDDAGRKVQREISVDVEPPPTQPDPGGPTDGGDLPPSTITTGNNGVTTGPANPPRTTGR